MGNCLKRSLPNNFISDKYLFEPLNPDESYLDSDENLNKSVCNCSHINTSINELNNRLNDIDNKINILEQNTRENFKSISDDIYYINEKQNQTQNSHESEELNQHASFIDEN